MARVGVAVGVAGQMSHLNLNLRESVKASALAFYIGDSLAMPVHWYYDLYQLQEDFGSIAKYEEPKKKFPGSIMSLSNTGGGGRGSDKGEIVGTMILHGKKEFWKRGGNYHYHHGMKAGDNTLDARLMNLLLKSYIDKKSLDISDYRNKYIEFMTTPNSHPDTYASTSHRMFFKNLQEGKAPENCPSNDGHNVDAIDALMIVPPVVYANLHATPAVRAAAIKEAIFMSRKAEVVLKYAYLFSEIMVKVIKKEATIRQAVQAAGLELNMDIASEVERASSRNSKDPMSACYIDSAFPVMLFMAFKYGDETIPPKEMIEKALLASANAGGENVARGAALGAIFGGAVGNQALIPTHLVSGLVMREEYMGVMDEFINTFNILYNL